MLSIMRRIRTRAPTCLSVGLGAFFAIMLIRSSLPPNLELVIAHSSFPCAIREMQVHVVYDQSDRRPSDQFVSIANEFLRAFVRELRRPSVSISNWVQLKI